MQKPWILAGALVTATFYAAPAQAASPDGGVAEFRSLYKELVETNTALSSGSCTLAADRMAARLRAAGIPDDDLHLFHHPDHPKEGGLVAIYPGSDPQAKAVLMLAHLDVVEAKREDWTRDPYTFIEEDGYFYGRGTVDDKAMAAIGVDMLIRFKQDGYKPRRTIKLALTCGEESNAAFNGAAYLAEHKRDLIDAAFAVNEGGFGQMDADGNRLFQAIAVGEKLVATFTLETVNRGGHSSLPRPDNAIYDLAEALGRIQSFQFPVIFNDTTRDFFTRRAESAPQDERNAIHALLADPQDAAARAVLERSPILNATLHTTCIPTLLEAGHAMNALPQRARATVNCRLFPGVSPADVQADLERAVDNVRVSFTLLEGKKKAHPPPPLDPKVLGPAEALAAKMWPGVPQLRTLLAGATDGAYLAPVGIPTYGIQGIFADPDQNGVHGLNERIRVKTLYESRDYLFELMKLYGDQAD
jgi:acetylornithine deacetylase/succinyl-diaminopimelate desuccinylase-like protein